MKLAQLSILALLAVAAPNALAQAPAPGGSAPAATTGGADGGAVSNEGSITSSTTTTTIDATATDPALVDTATPSGEMANTGGEPQLMALAGLLLASGGLFLRRKTSSQAI